ncbi:MAG: sulfatase [Alphaproteobacteria bacterium]|nr:sulfatase [Alphaproteobacteria bacterium]
MVLSEVAFAELQLPEANRETLPPDAIPITTEWRYTGETRQGMHKWATALPFQPRGLFFNKPEPGLELTRDDEVVRYDRFGKSKRPMWVHDRSELVVYLPDKDPGPTPGEYVLKYPRATERERELNLKWSSATGEEGVTDEVKARFAWSTASDGWDTRRGLLLPAPGVAAWDITVPAAGELRFVSGLQRPEIADGPPSDGADLIVEVEVAGQTTEVARLPLTTTFDQHHVDLSSFAGQQVRLRMKTDPGETTAFDYAFVAEPVVASRIDDPVRVVMVFIDTLRPDHMSLYGYERDTTAAIDHLAQDAVVFTQARSVAPWTLPSAMTIVTGRDPEDYQKAETETLPELLHREGFATAFFAGNVYLAHNFGMTRDWDFHRVGLWPQASETTDDALAWMEQQSGRNQLIQVHYMSAHVPYVEPDPYRHMYAKDGEDALRDGFMASDVRKANAGMDQAVQQYVQDRYDNNVRYATDQVQRIIEKLDDNDILLLYADHGEEFWDHQGFEHGHTLYDELLRVPLAIRAPNAKLGRKVDAPVSLLDLAPTVLDLLGEPIPKEMRGKSLLPLLADTPDAAASFETRDLAFGRPLYGVERWGVLHRHEKWTTSGGREMLFDVGVDPLEKKNLMRNTDGDAGAPYRQYLQDALSPRKVISGYRLVPSSFRGNSKKGIPGLWAMCTVPGGFSAAWKGEDPDHTSEAFVTQVKDPEQIRARLDEFGFPDHVVEEGEEAVEVCWPPGWAGSREVYLGPATRPINTVAHQMRCSAYLGDEDGGTRGALVIPAERDAGLGEDRTPLAKAVLNQRTLTLEFGIGVKPEEGAGAVVGANAEMADMLQAMGYAVGDEEGETTASCLAERR